MDDAALQTWFDMLHNGDEKAIPTLSNPMQQDADSHRLYTPCKLS